MDSKYQSSYDSIQDNLSRSSQEPQQSSSLASLDSIASNVWPPSPNNPIIPLSPFLDSINQWSPNPLLPVPGAVSVPQTPVSDPQLLALQQSLLQDTSIPSISIPNQGIKPTFLPSSPLQISIQPKLGLSSALPNISQQNLPPALRVPPQSQAQRISIKPSSGLSNLLSPQNSLQSSSSSSVPSGTSPQIPRTLDELSALLKQGSSPLAPKEQLQPAPAVILPSYATAVDPSISLIPLSDDKSVGSFGSEVEDPTVEASSVKPGDAVVVVRDLSAPILLDNNAQQNTYKVQVQNVQNQPIGYLPTRIGNWLSLLIPSGKLRLRARRPNQYTPNVLLLIEIFVSKISSDEWQGYTLNEKAAWRELSLRVGKPLGDIVPARSLQPELEPLLHSASQSLVKAGSNIKSSLSGTRSVGSSGSGGVKRSAETDIPLDFSSPSKRSKLSLGSSTPQVVVRFNASASRLPPQLAQSSPAAVKQQQQQQQVQQKNFGAALSASSSVQSQPSSFAESTASLSDQTERQFIDDLLTGLQKDYMRRSQELQNGTASASTTDAADEAPFYADVEPSSRMKLSLRPYQLEGLRWLTARESGGASPDEPSRSFKLQVPPGWTEQTTEAGKRYFVNDETKQSYWTFPYDAWATYFDRQKKRLPVHVCGGILADDMGMGKTIQILNLILANTPLGIDSMEEPKRFCPTLIVCPLSVLHQWYSEITSHVDKDVLSVYMYHGASRKKDATYLSNFDVVLTTYATLAGEHQQSSSNKGPLASVSWYRLVLDEAHTIKDRATLTAKAACALEAQRRWAVTGTPIQNKLAEIFSLFVFLRVEPFGDQEFWTNAIMKPIRNRDERGLDRLRSVLSTILLRRTKDQKVDGTSGEAIVSLPPRHVAIRRVEFSDPEKKFYDTLWENSKIAFETMLAHGTVMQNYAHVLELLLRVRQACDHPRLVLDHQLKRQQHAATAVAGAEADEATQVKDRLRSSKKKNSGELAMSGASSSAPEGDEMCECSVCYEDVPCSTAFSTRCDHTICLTCVQDYMLVREDDITQFEESLSGSGAGLSGTGHCPVCKTALQYADDITPLSASSAAAAAAKSSPIIKHEAPQQHDDGDYEEGSAHDDDEADEPKMDLRRSMAITASGAAVEEIKAELYEDISLKTSNTIGNLRSSSFNPSWTFMDPAQNYPVVSETPSDPVAEMLSASADGSIKKPTSFDVASIPKRSIKIQSLIDDLCRIRKETPEEKAVVFSQWTSMLDIIELALGEEGIAYCRLDGKMTQRAREEAINQFRNNKNIPIFLISMKAGGLGLNLVVANHVYLLDPWWNPSTEEQAIDRCHRIGQTRPVIVTRFIIQGSIEERILELQEKKRNLARGALGRKSAASLKEMRLEDLRLLFND